MSEKHRIFIPIFFVLIGACSSGDLALAEEARPESSSAMTSPQSSTQDEMTEFAARSKTNAAESTNPSVRTKVPATPGKYFENSATNVGPPVDPTSDPSFADKPRVWMDSIAHDSMVDFVRFAVACLTCAVFLAVKKRLKAAAKFGLLAIALAFIGASSPGAYLLAFKDYLLTREEQWTYVVAAEAFYLLVMFAIALIPLFIAKPRQYSKKKNLLIGILSIGGCFIDTLPWLVAMFLADSKQSHILKPENILNEESGTNPQK